MSPEEEADSHPRLSSAPPGQSVALLTLAPLTWGLGSASRPGMLPAPTQDPQPPRQAPDLHEPTAQVAAQDEADPLHLHLMDADLQVPLLGPLEIFFLFREKKKFVKKKKKESQRLRTFFCSICLRSARTVIIGNTEDSEATLRSEEDIYSLCKSSHLLLIS